MYESLTVVHNESVVPFYEPSAVHTHAVKTIILVYAVLVTSKLIAILIFGNDELINMTSHPSCDTHICTDCLKGCLFHVIHVFPIS